MRKRKMVEILDTIMIKALQSYDNYTVLNPLDVDIRSNYMTEKINNYKGYVYEVCIRNLLFSAGIKNDTQHIFCYLLQPRHGQKGFNKWENIFNFGNY